MTKHTQRKDGHSSRCKLCENSRRKRQRQANLDNARAREAQWREKNREKSRTYIREWKRENRDKVNQAERERRAANADRQRELRSQWNKENKDYWRYKNAERRARKLQATPKWADLDAIKKFYAACPDGYHVDHIIPLRGETVSGLHVLENLQYLPAAENQKKSNKLEYQSMYAFACVSEVI
jgi:hypothetical protein